ncbi:MAG: hypothetical protein LBN33_03630 [Desulfovibrio sp.]|nr:hypothetical protein [Desulfovibrio sp.]
MKNDANTANAILKEGIKRDIVTGTLNKLNQSGGKKKARNAQAAMSDTFHLSQSVLSSVYEGKGTLIDSSR